VLLAEVSGFQLMTNGGLKRLPWPLSLLRMWNRSLSGPVTSVVSSPGPPGLPLPISESPVALKSPL
jgi:hypothetical protein